MRAIEKIAILSVSILTIIATAALGPALGLISHQFPSASPLLIKSIVTLPALICILISYFSNDLTKFISKKNLIIIGIILYLIGGVASYFSTNIYFLLGTRAVLGLGLGVVAPLSLVLIGDFFEGKERAKFTGFSTSTSNLGAVIGILLVGYLGTINWRYIFFVYLIALIVLALVVMFLPNKKEERTMKANDNTKNIKLNKSVFKYSIIVILAFMVFYSVPTNIALFMGYKHLGSSEMSGMLIALLTFSGFIFGLNFGRLLKIFGEKLILLAFALMTIGVLVIGFAPSLLAIIIGVMLVGFGFGLSVPYSIFHASKVVHAKHTGRAITIVTTSIYVGVSISPMVLDSLAKLLHVNNMVGSFYGAAILGVIAILFSLYVIFSGNKKNESVAA